MSKGYSISVRIGGRALSLISDAKPEYMKNIAAKVDNSITGLLQSNSGLTFEKAAVLTALKFCDEAAGLQESQNSIADKQDIQKNDIQKAYDKKTEAETDNLRKQLITYSKELSELERENKALLKEIEMLKRRK